MSVYLGTLSEASTARYRATMYDETDTVIDGTALNSLTLTLYDKRTRAIVNSRNAQDVKNANGVVVTSDGALTWTISKDDTAVLGASKTERHVAVFVGTWSAGSKQFVHDIEMDVINIHGVG